MLGYFGPSRIVGRLDEAVDLADPSSSHSQLITENKPMIDLRTLVSLHDIERVALEYLPPLTRAQISAGANDNRTTKANASSFQDIYFRPRVLCSSRSVDCKTRILGREYAILVFNAPASLARLVHPDGELAIARGLAAKGSTIINPTMGSFLPEEIVAALPLGHPLFFQLYVGTNRESTKRLLESVVALKAEAIIVTVDLPVIGKRDDVRRLQIQASPPKNKGTSKSASNLAIDPDLSWPDIHWIRKITGLPVFVKGIQSVEDAKRALSEACAGIYISNHGEGRLTRPSPRF